MDIYKTTKYSHSSKMDWEWFSYSMYYLEASKHLAIQLKSHIIKNSPNKKDIKSMLVPIVYNLRHGIELLLKYLSFGISPTLHKTHDISELFKPINKALIAIDQAELHRIAASFDMQEKDVKDFFEEINHNIEQIVHKYHSYLFLTDGKTKIEDKKNELFRYPTIFTNSYKLDLNELSNKISADEILEDIEELLSFLLSITYLFGKTSNGNLLLDQSK